MYILLFSYIYSAYRPNYIQIITPSGKNLHLGSNVLSESNSRSCFKFIPRQIETYVEADGSPRYAVNSGLLTKIKGF